MPPKKKTSRKSSRPPKNYDIEENNRLADDLTTDADSLSEDEKKEETPMAEDKLTAMKIENIRSDVSDTKKELEALRRDYDSKVKDLEDEMRRVRDQNTLYRAELDQLRRDIESLKHSDTGKEVGQLKVDLAKLTERLTVMQVIQTTYSTVAGIVAAVVGKA